MTTATTTQTPRTAVEPSRSPLTRLRWTASDGYILVKRELEHLIRDPGGLATEFLLPVVVVLLFGYVLGSAVMVPAGGDYREYLIPGLFAMQALMGVGATITTIAADLAEGVMDRFRSMPMARSGVPLGHTASSLTTGVVNFLGIAVCAVVVGWRPHNGFWAAVAAFALLFLFRYAVAWLGVLVGLMFKSEETADHAVPLVFPVAMIANTFVPTDGMPEWLRVIADWNPLSALTNACRQLWGNPGLPHSGKIALPLQSPILATLIWSVGIIALAAPVAVWRFRNAGLR